MKEFHLNTQFCEESNIVCGEGVFESQLPTLLSRYSSAFVFTDSNVYALYREQIEHVCKGVPVHVMTAGEENKQPQTLFALLEAMAQAGLHRNSCLVALGGGVVGDVGGLASALYMRGIDCIQVPTTLLAQVDSSVGGKTAVDFGAVKNLVGAFHQPKTVLVDSLFFKTLPAREIRCGLGEIVKHAGLNAPLFDKLIKNLTKLQNFDFLAQIVPENIAIKANVVAQDAHEQGLRKCLNLGHTTAHAFELCDGKLSHGEYVLAGLIFEAKLAIAYAQDCDRAYLEQYCALAFTALERFPRLPSFQAAGEFARLDKKNERTGEVVITAPYKKGEFTLLKLPFEEYVSTISRLQEELC